VQRRGQICSPFIFLSPKKPTDTNYPPDSTGYCVGPDGKDLGADAYLVGPAYERWKKTPEYRKWFEETRPLK
jgi:hypothetical protein